MKFVRRLATALLVVGGASAPAAEGLRSEPFAADGETQGDTLFLKLPPERTGIDLVIPIDLNHPLKRAYHSSSACGAVAIGDLDGDGKVDIFAANGPGHNGLYLQREDLRFEEVAGKVGVSGGPEHWSVGVSIVDIDNDGDLDIYVCNYDSPNQLFLNRLVETGEFRFEEAAAAFGLDVVDASVMPAFADYDRDGDLDLYLLCHQLYRAEGRPAEGIKLVKLPDGTFKVSEEWALWYMVDQHRRGKNGELLYIECGRPDRLFRNDGPAGFTEVTAEAGISQGRHWGNSATWWDYNHDGWPDLYVGNDFSSPDLLFRNNGDGTFTEVIEDHVRHTTWFSMGAVQSDFNNDGFIDFLLADMMPRTHYMQVASMASMEERHEEMEHWSGATQLMRNTLHINTGADRFLEGAWMAGVAQTEWTWAIRSGDFDNDGWADLFFCNGVPRQFNHSDLPPLDHHRLVGRTQWDHYEHTPERREQNLAYRNRGDFQFEDVSFSWGLAHVGMSYGASLGDFNGDGRLDLVTSNLADPVSFYLNQGTRLPDEENRITVELEGTVSNRQGIGSVVRLETTDGQVQVRQLFPSGGFLDADQTLVHFGLGSCRTIRELRVDWPSGHRQIFRDLEGNRRYFVTEPDGPAKKEPAVKTRNPAKPWFVESEALEPFVQEEEEFDDFLRQPLLPFQLSALGGGQAWADWDGDGMVDVYLGGPKGQAGTLLRNRTGEGSMEVVFEKIPVPVFAEDAAYEDMGSVFLDVNGDGHLDLYVVSGGVECQPGDELLRDRIYFGDGQGGFTRAPEGTLPDLRDSGSVVAACDVDRDGDLDLFVGSRSIPGAYPSPPRSVLLRNDGGRFVKVEVPDLESAGMVAGAIWADVDGDGWSDLLVTVDWGPVRLFRNREGTLVEDTEAAGLNGAGLERLGWWTGIDAGDIDHDGDIDFVVSNLGRNTHYRASLTSPELMFYGNMDGTGIPQIIEARFIEEKGEQICYPRRGFMAAGSAMPWVMRELQTYHRYASAPLQAIYPIQALSNALLLRANQMDCAVFINDGKGRFEMKSLPALAQLSPAFGIQLADVDLDGTLDCFLVQNHFGIPEEIGVMKSGLGMLLRGTGNSEEPFEPVWPRDSGLEIPGEARGLSAVDLNADGRPDFVATVINGHPKVFLNQTGQSGETVPVRVRLQGPPGNRAAFGARVRFETPGLPPQTTWIKGGGSYLTQSGGDLCFARPGKEAKPSTLTVTWPDGSTTVRTLSASDSFVTLSAADAPSR